MSNRGDAYAQIPPPNRMYKSMQYLNIPTLAKHTIHLSISLFPCWVETETCDGRCLSIKTHATVATCIVLHTTSVYMKKHLKKGPCSPSSSIGWANNVVEAKKHMATMIYGRLELNPEKNNLIYNFTVFFESITHFITYLCFEQ